MKLYYCETPTGIKIYSLNKVITKQKKGVDIKILDVASYEDLCALREQLVDAKQVINHYLNTGSVKDSEPALAFVQKWGF